MRDRARVVIIGGGVGGCAIAYWLGRLGWDDVLLVERAELTSGSTFHSAGLVGQLRGSLSLTKMMMSSVELYRRLEAEVGLETGWREVGSLRLASSQERMEELARQAGWAKTFGLELDRGFVEAEIVVNAGGMFAAEIGRMAGVVVPIVPMAHEYLVTRPSGIPLGRVTRYSCAIGTIGTTTPAIRPISAANIPPAFTTISASTKPRSSSRPNVFAHPAWRASSSMRSCDEASRSEPTSRHPVSSPTSASSLR